MIRETFTNSFAMQKASSGGRERRDHKQFKKAYIKPKMAELTLEELVGFWQGWLKDILIHLVPTCARQHEGKKPEACSENSKYSSLSGIWYMYKEIVKDQTTKDK